MHGCCYLWSLIVSLNAVAGVNICPGASTQVKGPRFQPVSPQPFSPETGHKLSCERYPLYTRRKGEVLFPKTKAHQEESEPTSFAVSPFTSYLIFLNLSCSSMILHASSNLMTKTHIHTHTHTHTHTQACFFRSSSPYQDSHVM